MKNLSVIMGLFDHLNKQNSKTYIEYLNEESGVIKLSDKLELNIADVNSADDLERWLSCSVESSTR